MMVDSLIAIANYLSLSQGFFIRDELCRSQEGCRL